MKHKTHACIAFIVGRLIAGKTVTSIYDYSQSAQINTSSLPDEKCLRSFDYINWSYLSGARTISKYQFLCNAGHHIDLSVKGNTFIGCIRDCSTHFIGTVKGDSVYLFDQKESDHFNFRISGPALGH